MKSLSRLSKTHSKPLHLSIMIKLTSDKSKAFKNLPATKKNTINKEKEARRNVAKISFHLKHDYGI